MDITGKIEEVNQSDSLLLVVFYGEEVRVKPNDMVEVAGTPQ